MDRARLQPGIVLLAGTAVLDDPQCECCRDEPRQRAAGKRRGSELEH